jgi:hypothetical protein
MIPPPSQNTVGFCNQMTLPILYYISSTLVTLLKKSLMPLYKSLIFLFLLFVSSSLILAFRHSFFSFLKCLLASRLTLFRLSTFLWFEFCNRCILACFLCSKNFEHSSSNHGLRCFLSYSPRLFLAEILILSLMFSQALFTFSLSF